MKTDRTEEDRAKDVDIPRVQVIPCLTIAVKRSTTVDVHIVTAKLEESSGVLESLVEPVLLPVVGVVGELNCSLDVLKTISDMLEIYSRPWAPYQDRCDLGKSNQAPCRL
jgi:hypothetical protein